QAEPPADERDGQQPRDRRTADGRIGAAGLERSYVVGGSTCRPRVDDQIVLTSVPGEVFLRVVDDVIETRAAHRLEFHPAVDAGDLDVGHLRFRELDADRADAAAGTVDQDALMWLQ